MGYRELLKKYIRFLELNVGDNFIETVSSARESVLSKRDVAELKTLAGEIYRGVHTAEDVRRIENYNYRLRLLVNRYSVDAELAATLAGVDVDTLNRWRTSPRSERYRAMSSADFERFETAFLRFLDDRAHVPAVEPNSPERRASARREDTTERRASARRKETTERSARAKAAIKESTGRGRPLPG